MMNKMISLIKVDLNNTFGISSLVYNFKNKKNRWQLILFTFAMLSLIPNYIIMINGLCKIYEDYVQIGQQSYFLQTGIFATQMFVLLFGILYVLSKYYFSNDLNQLVPLPIKASHILGSKFITLMISEYLTSLPIILPFILIYGIRGGEGLIYWIYSFFLILGLPIIPLVISSILVMVFMKYTNIGGKKDLLRIIGFIMFLILLLSFQFKMQNIAQRSLTEGDEFFFELVRDSNLLVKRLGIIFPPSMWGTLALVNSTGFEGLSYLLLFFVVSILGYAIMILLSEKLFFGGLIGNIEVSSSKGKKEKIKEIEKVSNMTKPYIALAKKEIKMLFKTPVYVMNSVGGVIIVPIIIVMTILTGESSIEPLKDFVETHPHYLTLAGIGMITMLGMFNSIGVTTFSREGKNFWIQRTLPIKAEDQIIGRVLSSLVIQLIGAVVLIGSILIFIKVGLIHILIIILIGLLGSIPMTQLGMVIDILRPLLIWDNPQKAMKQNLNVLIGMGVGTIYGGAIFLLTINLLDKIDIGYVYFILFSVFIVSAYVLYNILKKLITKQFMELE